MKKWFSVFFIFGAIGFLSMLLSGSASAADLSEVKVKAAFEGVYQCFIGGAYRATFNTSNGPKGMILNKLSEESVKLPYGLTYAGDNNTNCKEILFGWGATLNKGDTSDGLNKGLLSIKNETDNKKIKDFFSGADGEGGAGTMGWKSEGVGNVNGDQTVSWMVIEPNLESRDIRDKNGNKVDCRSFVDEDGNLVNSLIFPKVTKDNNGNWFYGDVAVNTSGSNVSSPGSGGIQAFSFCEGQGLISVVEQGGKNSPNYMIYGSLAYYNSNGFGSYDSGLESIEFYVMPDSKSGYKKNGWSGFSYDIKEEKVGNSNVGDFEDYKLTYTKAGFIRPIKKLNSTNSIGYKLSELKGYSDLALTDQEVYNLYTYYINDVYKKPVVCEGETNYDLYTSSPDIKWKAGVKCKIDVDYNQSEQPADNVYGVDEQNHFTQKIGLDNIIDKLNSLDLNALDAVETGTLTPKPGSDNENGQKITETKTCMNAGGAQSLGWVLCPILQITAGAAESLYEGLVEPALRVEPELFKNIDSSDVDNQDEDGDEDDEKNGTYQGWETFRNFANTLFAIFLLVVIFSQLTGYGIDNYGIKKILPKLIVVAVLINLSYLICQVLIDLSNILGNSLQALFEGLPDGKPDGLTFWEGVQSVGSTFLITGLMTAIAGGSLWAVVAANPAGIVGVFIGLIIAALGALISLFFLFVILAVRKMAIVILVVISPLAIVCYALPNTKPLFDKYKKLGINLLMVYPIAGLIVGGGNYVSRLMLVVGNSGDFFVTFTAMMAGIVPIFFIPTVLRNSMSMIGSLGAKISGFGQNIGRRITGNLEKGVHGSERYKNYQDYRMKDRKLQEAASVRRRINRIPEADRTQRQKEQLLDADNIVNEYTQRAADARVGVAAVTPAIAQQRAQSSLQAREYKNWTDQNSQLTRAEMGQEIKAAAVAYDNDRSAANATRLMAAIASAESKGMHKELLSSESGLTGMKFRGNNSADARVLSQLAGSGNKVLSQYAKNRTKDGNADKDLSLNEFVKGIDDAGTTLTGDNLAEAFANKGADVLQGMNDDTLAYIKGTNRAALSTEQLISAATHTSDQKELTELNEMLAGRKDFRIKASDLANITNDTFNVLDRSVYEEAAKQLSDMSDASRQIIQSMNQEVKDSLVANGFNAFRTPPTP